MNIGFFIGEMNYRGVANSSYQYAYYNQILLRNKSIIFYNKEEKFHKKEESYFSSSGEKICELIKN